MLLTADAFDAKLKSGQLKIALIGMSNSGKSTSTRVLVQEAGFKFHEADSAINEAIGIQDMTAAAEWMGYPFEERYETQKRKYLELEEKHTPVEIPTVNFVLDTTGSVIYSSHSVKQWIKDNFLAVGLKITPELSNQMVIDYFENPKTVIWGSEFHQKENESGIEALRRCYPELLKNRSRQYSELSDVEISAEVSRSPNLTAEQLLTEIRSKLS